MATTEIANEGINGDENHSCEYTYRCFMPSDRLVRRSSGLIFEILPSKNVANDESEETAEADEEASELEEGMFSYRNKCGELSSILALELDLGFTYGRRLAFQHERDLRAVVFDCADIEEQAPVNIEEGEKNDNSALDAEESDVNEGVDVVLDIDFVRRSICENFVHPGLEVRYVNETVGHGLFATQPLPAGTFLGEYVGIVKSTSQADSAGDDSLATLSGYALMYPSTSCGFEIDSLEYGNLLRFANHSSQPCARFKRAAINGLGHVYCVSGNVE